MMITLFESEREATKEAVARPIPEDPPVIRTVLLRRFSSWEGEVLTMLESGMMLTFGDSEKQEEQADGLGDRKENGEIVIVIFKAKGA